MKMFINGAQSGGNKNAAIEVRRPHDESVIDTVPQATAKDVETALAAAADAADLMAKMPGHARAEVLRRAADLCDAEAEDLAQTVSAESGKPITEARAETSRAGEMFRLAAYEGAQMRGETLPLDALAVPPADDKLGFTLRVPCGVVVAITPFNFPALLVIHKIAPALAAGNSVILKPATATPLSALKLTDIVHRAGLPATALQCITGGGASIGDALCGDSRVRKISFTGSAAVGEHITRVAGVKALSLELGSNAPCIIMPDADLEHAAALSALGGFVNAGQVCISMQRVLAHEKVHDDYLDATRAAVEKLAIGAPDDSATQLSAMINESEAVRVADWTREACGQGAEVITGGERDGAVMQPTIVAGATADMKIFRDEVFGPLIGVSKVGDLDEALALTEVGGYGLAASIFTRDVSNAIRFARRAKSGNVHINWTPLWRNDLMPYGGFGMSGVGKEGIRSAVEAMSESKTVVIHGVG